MTVREAQRGEEERVLPMYEWLFDPPGSRPEPWDVDRARTALTEAIDSEDCAVLVAEEGGDFVGLCTAYIELNSVRFGQRCWVEDLAVDPEFRSRGIGKALLDAAKQWAVDRGATHLELDSALERRDAHRFYEREDPAWKSFSFGWVLDANDSS